MPLIALIWSKRETMLLFNKCSICICIKESCRHYCAALTRWNNGNPNWTGLISDANICIISSWFPKCNHYWSDVDSYTSVDNQVFLNYVTIKSLLKNNILMWLPVQPINWQIDWPLQCEKAKATFSCKRINQYYKENLWLLISYCLAQGEESWFCESRCEHRSCSSVDNTSESV